MGVGPTTQHIGTHNDEATMTGSDTGKGCYNVVTEARESNATNRHVLFPSRSPPPKTKRHSSMKEKTKRSSVALLIDELAAAKISPSKATSNVAASSSPLGRALRQTMHRRSKHVFVSSQLSTRSKSSSPSKAKQRIRKHHRGHNFALNSKDFEILFQAVKG